MKKLVILAVLVLLGGLGVWLGLPKYRQYKQDHLARLAMVDLAKGDFKTAALRARSILAMNESNPAGSRIMADVLERVQAPNELEWRQRVVELVPNSTPDRLELARCATIQGENALAVQALQGVRGADIDTVAYHNIAALVLTGLGDLPGAEHHLLEAAHIDPTNRLVQINAAVIHLHAKNPRVVAQAMQTLEQLTTDPVYRMDALRHLVMASIHANDPANADKFSAELVADPSAQFEDRLMRLGVLKATQDAQFTPMLEKLSAAAEGDPDQIYALAEWMYQHDQADLASGWLDSLPAAMRGKPMVELARADGFMGMKDWAGLKTRLSDENWGDADYVRDAIMARASREQGLDFKSQNDWLAAVHAASDGAQSLSALIRLVNSWGWDKEREDLLWMMVQKYPAQRWAIDVLRQLYLAAGNTHGLQKLNDLMVGFDSRNYDAKNDLAMFSLLLNTELPQAHSLAAEVYAHAPTNSAYASTQAFSLYQQGQAPEALQIMDHLKPAELEQPSVALYYGLVLAANGQTQQAQKYLKLAKGGNLLPEEKILLNRALGTP